MLTITDLIQDLNEQKKSMTTFIESFDNCMVDQFVVLDESGMIAYTHDVERDTVTVFPEEIQKVKTFSSTEIVNVLQEYKRIRGDQPLQSIHIVQGAKMQLALLEKNINMLVAVQEQE